MKAHFIWARVLALLSLVVPAAGCLVMLHNTGSLLGLAMIIAGIPLAVAGWIALGTPVTRQKIQRAPNGH